MKHLVRLTFVLFILAGFLNFNSIAQENNAKIEFEETEHDFGTFKESDGVQTTDFIFTNSGNVPLILNNVRASCGCTTPQWTREPIAPGENGTIKVSYDPKNRPGTFNKTVTVQSNASNAALTLRILGKVEEREKTIAELYPRQVGPLRVVMNQIPFSKIKNNEISTKTMELVNDTDEPISVGFKTVPSPLTATMTPEIIPAHEIGILEVTLDANEANTYGLLSKRIYLSINGSNDYTNSIGVSATVEEDFSELTEEELANAPIANFSENAFDFGEINQDDKVEHIFNLINDGERDLIIRNVRSSCGCTAVSPSKKVIAPGETAPIKVVFDSTGKKGKQTKTITVITNDPQNPTTTLRISTDIKVVS